MTNSILDSIKLFLNVNPEITAFDVELIMYINSQFTILEELGVGKENFKIRSSSEQWDDYLKNDDQWEAAKTCIGLRVKLVFDPPANSFTVQAMKDEAARQEWYLLEKADRKRRENEH